jgi:hypothetical protein
LKFLKKIEPFATEYKNANKTEVYSKAPYFNLVFYTPEYSTGRTPNDKLAILKFGLSEKAYYYYDQGKWSYIDKSEKGLSCTNSYNSRAKLAIEQVCIKG